MFHFKGLPVCLTSHDYKANIVTAPLVPVIDTALLRQKENYFDPCLLLGIFFCVTNFGRIISELILG